MNLKQKQSSNVLVVVLEKGEELVSTLTSFCQENEIFGAWVSGIGAVSKAELALYDLSKKEYHGKKFSEPLEIASLSGNIAKLNGEATAHLHAVLSDKKMKTYAGHLSNAVVAATCEVRLEIFDAAITRKHNKEIGLNLING